MDYGSERTGETSNVSSLSPLSPAHHLSHLYNLGEKRLGTSEPFIFQVRQVVDLHGCKKSGILKFLLRMCLVATCYNHDGGEQ